MKKTSGGTTTVFLGMEVEIVGGVMTKYLPGDGEYDRRDRAGIVRSPIEGLYCPRSNRCP